MRIIAISLLSIGFMFATDYSFDMDEIEVKDYEYSGYLQFEQKHQKKQNNETLDSFFGEVQINFNYFYDDFTLNSQFQANHKNIDNKEQNTFTTNQLFLEYKNNINHTIMIGKKSLKWGKGYFFNPIAFFDRKKDPNNPENSREGYILANYKYNKSYSGNLKNFSFDVAIMPTSKNINSDFYNKTSTNIVLKTYFLYFDTDIDVVYLYSDKLKDKIGVDFSKNIKTNFEIHGEVVKELNGYSAYLIGLRYLTTYNLTIITEYFYRSIELSKKEPFYDNRYLINKLSLKEPFKIVYLTIYYKNSLNIDDNSKQNSLGFTYSFKNNIKLDVSYNKNSGSNLSEFGSKSIDNTIWSKLVWYF